MFIFSQGLWLFLKFARIVVALAKRLKIAECKPRTASSIGWFHSYDANIIGGLLQGCGMVLTGVCPGTVFVQMALGIRTAWTVVAGGVLGGILYSGYGQTLRSSSFTPSQSPQPATVQQKYNLKESHVILGFETLYAATVTSAILLEQQRPALLLSSIPGGFLIGGAQASSLLLTGNTLGVSTVFEQCGQIFWWLWNFRPFAKTGEIKRPSIRAMGFAGGIMAGAWALAHTISLPEAEGIDISTLRALAGGVMLSFGARLAGGCTSGHGISGMATFSIASFVTAASMFAGGIALATVL